MSLTTPEKLRELQRKLYVKAKEGPAVRFHALYDKVYRKDILVHAYALARSNGGAAGVDGITFAQIESQGLMDWIERLGTELREKTYHPSAVRRVMIPKPGGGERPLGIPTIRDRVAQTAAKLILEPIFEADLEDSAYGYRPQRSARDAVEVVHRSLCEGYTDIVDADLSRYFDTIPHDKLMLCLARRIVDGVMLKLIKSWLKVPVEERDESGRRHLKGGQSNKTGTPQGGVISPLLANLYMNRFLKGWRQQGKGAEFRARLVNYADDFVILSQKRALDALSWTRQAMTKLGLVLNEQKTRLCDARSASFDFLGYTFGSERYRKDGHWYLAAKPSKKAVSRLKEKIRQRLCPGNQGNWQDVRQQLNQMLRGWVNYFSYGTRLMAYRAIDNYVTDRVRNFLRRRHKVSTRGTRCFSADEIHAELGVLHLRRLHLGAPPSVSLT